MSGSFKRRHAPTEVRAAAVEAALRCTHVHPEGVEGAAVQAHAVAALALSDPSGSCLPPPPPLPPPPTPFSLHLLSA